VECFEKARRSKPLFPLKALQNFEILHSDSPRVGYVNPPRSITAQQLAPPGETRGRIPLLSPHRQTSSKETASTPQKGNESDLKTTSAKPNLHTKEITSRKEDDVDNSAIATPEEYSSSDNGGRKLSGVDPNKNDTAADVDVKKSSPEKHADSVSKKTPPAKADENPTSSHRDPKKASPEMPAEKETSCKVASQGAPLAKAAETDVSDSGAVETSAQTHPAIDNASKKLSPTKSTAHRASDNNDSKKPSSVKPAETEGGELKERQRAKTARTDDGDSKKASPTKSAENQLSNNGDSKKPRSAYTDKQLLPSTSEPNSQTLSLPTDTVKKPPSGRKSQRLPSLPTPAPPLVSGIERLAKSPYGEPVMLKMTHSSTGEHKKSKGVRPDGKQSRGS